MHCRRAELFDDEEVSILRKTIELDENVERAEFGLKDQEDRMTTLTLWNYAPDGNTYSNFIRAERVVKYDCSSLPSHYRLRSTKPTAENVFVFA